MMFLFVNVQVTLLLFDLYRAENVCDTAFRPVTRNVAPTLTGFERSEPEIAVASPAATSPVPPLDKNDIQHIWSSEALSSVPLIITNALPLAVIVAAIDGPPFVVASA